MSFFAEGTSITRPPLLNDTNYPYWKVRMRAFIKSQDERAWRSILSSWTPPIEKYDKGFIKLISSCEFAKEAWQIPQTRFEGTIDLSDIANEFFSLGEKKLDESVLVRKIVCVLPDRFETKFLAMEEAKDFGKMKVEELMDVSGDEMALLARNFRNFMKKVGNKKNFSKTPKDYEKVALTSVLSSAFHERGNFLCLNDTLTDVNKKVIDSDSDESELSEESLAESYKGSVFTVERSVSTEMKQSGDKDFLVNIRLMQCGEVTFGNGLAGNVMGMRTLNFEGLPRLKNVMLVEGLRANLLSVSQICDQGYTVNFDSNHCYVVNDQDEIILHGFRSNDNCYTLTTYATCHSAIDNCIDLWHEKLGHIHFKNLKKLSNAGIVQGLPNLGKESVGKCEPCQLGPIQVESLNDFNIGKIVRIRSDHGKQFENTIYDEFCKSKDDLAAITESSPEATPQDTVATTDDFPESSTEKETKQPPNIITDPIQREPSSRVKKNHPNDLILGNMDESMVTRRRYANLIQFVCFISSLEPKNVKEALMDEA
ncbi:uncharacterized protein LOC133814391 [Humulus lupulus]|uniref:uncharacterized protein LOC133814391 n=1 Tax=Humulus lupulus TaxID=3486 RepID=UPI002B406725|nr:uncharacterized protein LOC133814391 [Humulus lupulus]